MSPGTKRALGLSGGHRMVTIYGQTIVGDFIVKCFDTEHDADNPVGFLIQYRPTGEKLLFLTDSYYCKYQFPGLQYILIECNYIKETLDWNIEHGYIHEAMRPRLLQSHMSLEHCIQLLKANDLSQCRELILIHLSSQNADASRMIREIEEVTGIKPKVAVPGLMIDLQLYPY